MLLHAKHTTNTYYQKIRMNWLSFIAVLLFCFIPMLSQAGSSGIERFYEAGKVGYRFAENKTIISPAVYDAGGDFQQGRALVIQNNKRGFINSGGIAVIPLRYDDAGSFFEGLARVKENGRYGYIDTNGTVIIPFTYELAYDFAEGHAVIQISKKQGLIDRNGKSCIAPEYDFIYSVSEGLAAVSNNGKWGFADTLGQVRISLQYAGAHSFKDGKALVFDGDKRIIINRRGKHLETEKISENEAEEQERSRKKHEASGAAKGGAH